MILDCIVEKKRLRVQEIKKRIPIESLKNELSRMKISDKENIFKKMLRENKFSVIGEFKKASPSKGVLCENFDINYILDYYNDLNIDIFSVLTEEDFFLGSDEYLKYIRKKTNKPILRKDFIVDVYQVYEAKLLKADAILLIAAILKESLGEFYNKAKKLNIEPLVEVHNKEELDLAPKYDCEIIGINNRDLKTFNVDLNNTKELMKYIPKDKIVVSESGLNSIQDFEKAKSYGVNAVLVGEFFMKRIDNKFLKEEYKLFKERL